MDKIIVQTEDFDLASEVELIKTTNSSIGAVVSFIGTVRDLTSESLVSLTLEHYPGMTEKSLRSIAKKARKKVNKLSIKLGKKEKRVDKLVSKGKIKRADAKISRVNKKVQKKVKKAVKGSGLSKSAVNVSRMRISKPRRIKR